MWESTPPIASFFTKLKRVTRQYKHFYIKQAKTLKQQEDNMCQQLTIKTKQLHDNPQLLQLQDEVNIIHYTLVNFEKQKAENQKLWSRAR